MIFKWKSVRMKDYRITGVTFIEFTPAFLIVLLFLLSVFKLNRNQTKRFNIVITILAKHRKHCCTDKC